MLRDYIRLALHNIRHRQIRSWLTILGIVVGVAAVVALIAIGQGMQKSVQTQFEAIGYNTIIMFPGGTGDEGVMGPGGGMMRMMMGGTSSTAINIEALGRLPQVVRAGVQRIETALVTSEYMEGQGFLRITGLSHGITDDFGAYFDGFPLAEGTSFGRSDGSVVILGGQVALDLGVATGNAIQIEGNDFEVIGILEGSESGGGGFTFRNLDTGLFVPIEALEALFGGEGTLSLALIETTQEADVGEVSLMIRALFRQLGTPVGTITAEEMSEQLQGVLGTLQMVLAAIAAISLVVGGIGVMNTMYTSVLERTREIGIMKAIGAKDRQVLYLFLVESGFLGAIGGAIGVLLGVGLSSLASRLMGGGLAGGPAGGDGASFSASLSPGLIIGALAFSFVLGAIAGVLPARRGAKLQPVEALRYE